MSEPAGTPPPESTKVTEIPTWQLLLRKPAFLSMCAAVGALLTIASMGWPAYRVLLGLEEEPAATARPQPGGAVSFSFIVESVPDGAKVKVDGSSRGSTPYVTIHHCRANLPIQIEVSADGYRTWTKEEKCAAHGKLRVLAELTREP